MEGTESKVLTPEEKIEELEKRITELENKLKPLSRDYKVRKTKKIISITIKLAILIAIGAFIWRSYVYVNEKIIKPYNESIAKIEEKYDSIKDKYDELKDKFDEIKESLIFWR